MATLPDLSDLPVIAGIIASTVFATYAVISLIMRPYESPQYVTAKMKSTVNHRYIQSRRLLAVVYIALAIAGWFVVPPARHRIRRRQAPVRLPRVREPVFRPARRGTRRAVPPRPGRLA